MLKQVLFASLLTLVATIAISAFSPGTAQAAGNGQPTDWNRFYNYPYVYYPHNFERPKSYDHMYYRYPANRRIPVYNTSWHNYYPSKRPYHSGNHFILDVF